MDINIYINQKKINPLYLKGIDEYVKRLTPYCRLSLICRLQRPATTAGRGTANICVVYGGTADTFGKSCENISVSSEKFAELIDGLASSGVSHVNFYIGYQESAVHGMARLNICTLSVSADMKALMLSEQIYRAFTILNHITYHK